MLVILGLLTGGILTGQNLIRAAELRSVTTEFQKYQTAVMTFRDKYFYLPGDMRNATDFWGAQSECSGSSSDGVCNGDGDGLIDSSAVSNAPHEEVQAFRQMALAGLIEGDYPGTNIGTSVTGAIPTSKLGSNVSWRYRFMGNNSDGASSTRFRLNFRNVMHINNGSTHNLLTPEEAWNIDSKVDDGKPAQGRVTPLLWDDDCTTASSNADLGSDYTLSYRSKACTLYFTNM